MLEIQGLNIYVSILHIYSNLESPHDMQLNHAVNFKHTIMNYMIVKDTDI